MNQNDSSERCSHYKKMSEKGIGMSKYEFYGFFQKEIVDRIKIENYDVLSGTNTCWDRQFSMMKKVQQLIFVQKVSNEFKSKMNPINL